VDELLEPLEALIIYANTLDYDSRTPSNLQMNPNAWYKFDLKCCTRIVFCCTIFFTAIILISPMTYFSLLFSFTCASNLNAIYICVSNIPSMYITYMYYVDG
jgi:hypothetical protein